MTQIDFDYDIEEIVQMDGVGPVSLKSALKRMPNHIGVLSMLHRDVGARQLEQIIQFFVTLFHRRGLWLCAAFM